MKRFISFIITLTLLIGLVSPITAKAATSVTRIWWTEYDESVVLTEGEKLTQSKINSLKIQVMGQTSDGNVHVTVKVKEKNQYIYANKHGKMRLTLTYKGFTDTLDVKVKKRVTKLSVKAKSKASLKEGQILTLKDARNAATSFSTYENGKKVKCKAVLCKEVGKIIKANKKGYMKLTYYIGSLKKTVNVKVVPLKRIYITTSKMKSLTEKTEFSPTEFKSKHVVKGKYKNGSVKTLTTYSVIAAKKVTGKKFSVTVKYGKFKDTIKIPVKKPVTPVKKVTASVKTEGPGKALVNGKNSVTVTKGTKVTYTATPGTNAIFKGWKVGNSFVSTASSYPTPVNANLVVTAVFEKKPVPPVETVTASVKTEGPGKALVNGKNSVTVTKGTKVTYTATPGTNAIFKGWKVGNSFVSTTSSYTTPVNANLVVTAVFEKKPVPPAETVTATVSVTSNGGKFTIDGKEVTKKTVPVGTAVLLEAEDTEHFKFLEWEVNGQKITSPTHAFVVNENTNVKLVFDEVYSLDASAENGKVLINDVEAEESVTTLSKGTYRLTNTLDEGYEFVKWVDGEGNELGSNPELEITLDKDMVVVAKTKRIECKLNLSLSANAIDSDVIVRLNNTPLTFVNGVAEPETFFWGSELTIKVTDTATKFFTGLIDVKSEEKLSEDKTYTFKITEDTELMAVFGKANTLKINRVGGKGIVIVDGERVIFTKDVGEVVLLPGTHRLVSESNDDFTFVNYEGLNSSGTPETTPEANISMSDHDMEITVTFRETGKTVVVTFVTQYSEPVDQVIVPFGGTVESIPSYPKFGYTFLGWELDGKTYSEEEYDVLLQKIQEKTSELDRDELIITGQYQKDELEYYKLDVANGNIVSFKGEQREDGKYAAGTKIFAQADPEDPANGKFFNGWIDTETGVVLCDYMEFDFTMSKDMSIAAVYSGTPGQPIPRTIWDGNGASIDSERQLILFTPKVDVPSNYQITEWGVLLSKNTALTDEQINLENIKNSRYAAAKGDNLEYPNNHRWEWTYDNPTAFAEKWTFRARIYLCVKNIYTGVEETLYSGCLTVDLANLEATLPQ